MPKQSGAIEIRSITDDEYAEYARTMGVGFGYQPTDDNIDYGRPLFERDRSVGAFDAGRMVATAGVLTMELTVPGGALVPAGGVTAVSVLPSHRRLGILTKMMSRMFDDCVAHKEPIAMLWASESIIYGRYGYGIGSLGVHFEIEREHARLAHPVDAPGRVRVIEKDHASKVLPEIFDRFRTGRPGAVNRSPAWWSIHLVDPEWERGGASALFFLIYEAPGGRVDGFAEYRVKRDWSDSGISRSTAIVNDLVAVDEIAATALWQTCLDIDLTAKISGYTATDEPLRWRLADPRRFLTKAVNDALWVRILDVPTLLKHRTYPTDGRLVFEVADPVRPEVAGRYELEVSGGKAAAKRSKRKADLELGIAELSSLSLGAVSATALTRSGRVRELGKGAVARADNLFACHPVPWTNTDF